MLIIFLAIILIQGVYIVTALMVAVIDKQILENGEDNHDYLEVERQWHNDVAQLITVDEQSMQALFHQWSSVYPESSMFWVDEYGQLSSSWQLTYDIPDQWTSSYTVNFMKERYGNDPYTVVALVGENATHGFAVFEIPRSVFDSSFSKIYIHYGSYLFLLSVIIILLFILISYLFFRKIRKRLLQLQYAMNFRNSDGLPVPLKINKMDEIGELQDAFNQMITELRESKHREAEEEKIRRDLIANLSHDLRTPLTKIQANAYSLSKQELTSEASESVKVLQKSVNQIDSLIENLMSYTLLHSHKYRLEMKEVNVIRFLREHLATWYASFEKEGFEIDVSLEEMSHPIWEADPIWMTRIMDNLYQNVLRHASSGRYISLSAGSDNNSDFIIVKDHGGGLLQQSSEKGVGIGLSIVDMMIKEMNLSWSTYSNEQGFTVTIKRTRTN